MKFILENRFPSFFGCEKSDSSTSASTNLSTISESFPLWLIVIISSCHFDISFGRNYFDISNE
jgi:hypothetical protein